MKRLALLYLVLTLLTLITPAYASVELKATIDQSIHVVLELRNINATIYEEIRDESDLDETKVPRIIEANLGERGLENVDYGLPLEPLTFDDIEKSITVAFLLWGSDILESTFSTETMRRTYRVRTDWRWFELNLTDDLSLNFTKYFEEPLSAWDFDDETHPTYYHNFTSTILLDPVCYFILPREATNVHVEGEFIVFELPPSLGESLVNSPFLILGGVVVVIAIAFLYRSVRKQPAT